MWRQPGARDPLRRVSVSQHEADCFPAGSEWEDIGHFEIDADLIFFYGCDFLLLPLIHV